MVTQIWFSYYRILICLWCEKVDCRFPEMSAWKQLKLHTNVETEKKEDLSTGSLILVIKYQNKVLLDTSSVSSRVLVPVSVQIGRWPSLSNLMVWFSCQSWHVSLLPLNNSLWHIGIWKLFHNRSKNIPKYEWIYVQNSNLYSDFMHCSCLGDFCVHESQLK